MSAVEHGVDQHTAHGRVVGLLALALAASILAQNIVVIAAAAPGYGDPIKDVFTFHAQHGSTVAIAVGLEALNLPLLLGLVTGLRELIHRRGVGGQWWARIAAPAAATLSAIWALYAATWIGTVLSTKGFSEPHPAFTVTWQLHAAAFALALPALGTTFLAVTMATRDSGLTPLWQSLLGIRGGVLLIAAGGASLAIADGSPMLFVGMPGYFLWIVWLIATGVRLMSRKSTGGGTI